MTYRERDEEKRRQFQQELEDIKKQQEVSKKWSIVYIDESGIDHNDIKRRSWSPIGHPTPSNQYGYRYLRTTLLAWVRWDIVVAPMRFEGSTNTDIFNLWIEECLCPELKQWDVVVLDNASFHKSDRTRILIEKRGAKLLYLPPYSPDMNPIENYWAILKAYVRKRNTSFDIFYDVLDGFLRKQTWCWLS